MGNKQMSSDDYDYDNEPKKVKKGTNKTKKKKKRIFLKIVIVLLAIIIVFAGILVGFIYSKFTMYNYDDIDESQIEVNEGVETATGYRNIFLFGVDSRKNSYENTLSDVIMIVSINQDTKKVKIASVYRDTYLKIGKKFDKVTHAYMQGGPTLSMSTLNTNLDLDIKEYVAVNFNVVVDVVDAVGGVEIDITNEEVKYINEYIDEVNNVTGHNSKHVTKAGKQTLDGVQAVAYSRIRYTAGGDYKRTERQREVLDLAFAKIKKMNIGQLNSLADTVLKEISTNITSGQILGLLSQVASYQIEDNTGWPFEGGIKGYQPGKVWYGAPVNLEKQVQELHKFLFDKEDYEVSNTVKTISNALIKETGYK